MPKTQILIVEDQVIMAESIRNNLQKLGYTVSAIVSSGEEAIQCAERFRPDLVLMDIELEGELDGVQTAERIRNRFDVPVVFATAYGDDETLRRARISEPFGYILKPFTARDLHSNIEMALYKHRAEQDRREMIRKLEKALAQVQLLSGLLPICASCKKIRDDQGHWQQLEAYIAARSEAEFSHGICPDCAAQFYPELDLYGDDE